MEAEMKAELELPPVIYRGKVSRIRSPNCVEVVLDLRFSVQIERGIVLEGIDTGLIPAHRREQAMYCLILLLSKRNVLVHTDDSQRDGFIKGRIFLAEAVRNPPVPLQKPYRVDTALLEVSSFYQWLGTVNYDHVPVARLYGNNVPARKES